jgi:hypothetical protein
MRLYDAVAAQEVASYVAPPEPLCASLTDSTHNLLILGFEDGALQVWQLGPPSSARKASLALVCAPDFHRSAVRSINSNGPTVLSLAPPHEVVEWNPHTGAPLRTFLSDFLISAMHCLPPRVGPPCAVVVAAGSSICFLSAQDPEIDELVRAQPPPPSQEVVEAALSRPDSRAAPRRADEEAVEYEGMKILRGLMERLGGDVTPPPISCCGLI